MKKKLLLLHCIFVVQLCVSCAQDDYFRQEEEKTDIIPADEERSDNDISLEVSLFANNSKGHQSSAAYGDYLFLVPDKRSYIHCYNLKTKQYICSKYLGAVNEKTIGNYILYHCNQTSFGADFYDKNDPFPLLYISQRARSDERCFVEVYRLLPVWSNAQAEYVSLDAQLVQTIYFPVQSVSNSLGRINCAVDTENHFLYTYSYGTLSDNPNRSLCRISSFAIPDITKKEVTLNDDAILESYQFDYKATNSQGGCIKKGKLYIAQGFMSVGIYLNIIDIKKRELFHRINLNEKCGVAWEPEGCFFYNDNLMMSTGANIWQFTFSESN